MPRIVIHIGFERTGTTSLQSCLASNRAVLARYSILYPKRSPAFNGLNHTPLVAAYMPENREDPFLKVPAGRRAAIIASLKREIDGSAQDTIILSAEHFSSRFRYDQIEALRADFAAYECRILLVLRDHISSFASAYSSHVTAGGRLTIEAFADEVLIPGNVYLRYSEMIGPWQKIFGHDQVNCLAYRKGTIDDVFAKIGVPTSTALNNANCRKNVSDNPTVIAILRQVNEVLFQDAGVPGSRRWWHALYLQKAIAARLRAVSGDVCSQPLALERSRLVRLQETAKHDEARLVTDLGLRLIPASIRIVEREAASSVSASELMLARALVHEVSRSLNFDRWRSAVLSAVRPLENDLNVLLAAVRRT